MDLPNTSRRFVILMLLLATINSPAVGDDCSEVQSRCHRETFKCPFRSYFADIYRGTICRGCNVCIKPGSPVDSKGCPQLPCPDIRQFTAETCRKPEVYNSWVVYHDRKCPTCAAMFCEMASKRN